MKKSYMIFLIGILFLTGCENKEEMVKNEYIAMKSNLLNTTTYTKEELPLEITTYIDRVGEEEVDYKVIFDTPKENMYQIKAMVVHNYYNEDTFPSIGVFDEPKKLLLNQEKNQQLELQGTIKTVKNISKLDLQLKVWIEYTNENGETKDIYYKI